MEKNLHRINLEWRETLDALSDLVILVGADGRILRVNRTAEMWGLGSVRSLPGQDLHKALHPVCDDADCYLENAWEELRDPVRREKPSPVVRVLEREFEDWLLGRRIRLTVRQIGESGGDGLRPDASFAVFVLRDVTVYYHRRVTRSRRRQLETLGHLVRGLAHEIGNPLAAVKTSAQVLLRSFDRFSREKKENYLRRISEETDRIQAIVDRVLREQQWKIGPLVAVSVEKLFSSLTDLFADEMAERGIEFAVESTGDPSLALAGDPAAVDMVFAVVLDNAMDACRPGDRVLMVAHQERGSVRVEVRDTGSGMNPGDLERIFQPFFSTKSRGSGLGMSHAHQLLEQMKGRLDVTSAEGEGTRVHLVFRSWSES